MGRPRSVRAAATTLALAIDYDGTLATHGIVPADVVAAIRRLRASGRAAVLVTGRRLPDLRAVFPDVDVFDEVVAENGALLHTPAEPEADRALASPPPGSFAAALEARAVVPLACGRVIVATTRRHEATVRAVIRDSALDLDVVFNEDALMVLPSGVDKASGVRAALAKLGIAAEAAVGVGDAENDVALLAACGLGVAVANAVPALEARADLVTTHPRGRGVIELVDRIVATDLADVRRTKR